MGKVYKCPKCKGSGKVLMHDGDTQYYFGTFGIGFLVDVFMPNSQEDCPICDGCGYLQE